MEISKSFPLISIIIPVYNVYDYLEDCVLSAASQTYDNLEIILVDDGSTDGCADLCDSLAKTDHRISVVHKENGGLGDARNAGLRHAEGDLISFVDSDDIISSRFLESLFVAMVEADSKVSAVKGGTSFRDNEISTLCLDEAPIALSSNEVLTAQEYIKRMLYQRVATGAPWRLYRREVLGNDPFPVGYYYEDLGSTYRFVAKAEKVALLSNTALYGYRLRAESIIRQSYSSIKAESALQMSRRLYGDICDWYPDLMDAASSRCFSVIRLVYSQALGQSALSSDSRYDLERLWGELGRYKHTVLKDSYARKRERIAALTACLGRGSFSAFCTLCRRVGLLQ